MQLDAATYLPRTKGTTIDLFEVCFKHQGNPRYRSSLQACCSEVLSTTKKNRGKNCIFYDALTNFVSNGKELEVCKAMVTSAGKVDATEFGPEKVIMLNEILLREREKKRQRAQ